MSRTRTFIAVEIGDEIRDRAVELQQTLGRSGARVKWVAPDSMHVTLVFLGEVDDRNLHEVCRAVREVAASEPPFTLHVSGVGAYPTARRPKVAWAGIVDGRESLCRLHEALERRLLEMGCYRKEEREYSPHLTLGRVNGEADAARLAPELAKRQSSWHGGRTRVEELIVFGSVLEKDGPVHTVLGRGKLTGTGKDNRQQD